MAPDPRSEERYHHGDLRRALIAAALEILEEGGEPSLRAVARRAGVSHTAPYHHFRDRRKLIAAVAEEGFVAFRDALLAGAEGADPRSRHLASGVAYVRFAVENPARFRLMFSAELADRSDLLELRAASDAAFEVLLENVRAILGPGAGEAAVRARALGAWSIVHGLSMLILDGQVHEAVETTADAERIARAILRSGVPATGTPPPAG